MLKSINDVLKRTKMNTVMRFSSGVGQPLFVLLHYTLIASNDKKNKTGHLLIWYTYSRDFETDTISIYRVYIFGRLSLSLPSQQ